jgi:hypothetical protein
VPYVTFVPVGKRKSRGWQGGYDPFCVILKGHGLDLRPDSTFDTVSSENGMVTSQSRYSACDERWVTDFNGRLNAYLEGNPDKVIADYRNRKNT